MFDIVVLNVRCCCFLNEIGRQEIVAYGDGGTVGCEQVGGWCEVIFPVTFIDCYAGSGSA